MIPAPRLTRLAGHKYKVCGIELLKMASCYGANGAGKSNVIRALALLQELVVTTDLPSPMRLRRMRHFYSTEGPIALAVEFINQDVPYIYAVEIGEHAILKEELYISGLGKQDDELVFRRLTEDEGKTVLQLSDTFTRSKEGLVLKGILENNLIKQNKTCLKILSELDSPLLTDTTPAYQWFAHKLLIITADATPGGLAHRLDIDEDFLAYAQRLVRSFTVGIEKLRVARRPMAEFLGDDNRASAEALYNRLSESPDALLVLRTGDGEEVVIVDEGEGVVVKQLKTEHTTEDGTKVLFDLSQESAGTRRLMDYLLAFKALLTDDGTCFIDEIERSIHPLLIKEIIAKFSADDSTRGQLVCMTHESNLLDQDLFRQDEIWFVEKDLSGSSDLYSLSDFKEHSTIDIRKGYLTGRYGSIPLFADPEALKWIDHDPED